MRPQKRNERGTLPRFSRGERSCKQSVMAGQVPERRSPRPKRHKQQLTPAEGQRLPLTAREADEELLPEVVDPARNPGVFLGWAAQWRESCGGGHGHTVIPPPQRMGFGPAV